VLIAEWHLPQAEMTLRFGLARIRAVEDSDKVVTDNRHVRCEAGPRQRVKPL